MSSTLFQVGTILSFLSNTQNSLSMKDILSQGNYGLGTFKNINGELIVWDGKAYRIDGSGRLTLAKTSKHSHFAWVCPWHTTSSIHVGSADNFKAITQIIDTHRADNNQIYMFKFTCLASTLEFRSECKLKQSSLSTTQQLAKNTHKFHLTDNQCHIIGCYFPNYLKEINISGYHIHALSPDQLTGGHVFDLSIPQKFTIELCKINQFNLHFPPNSDTEIKNLDDFIDENEDIYKLE